MKQCDRCNTTFETVSALANHVRWVHKRDDLTKECVHCGERFQTANILLHEEACSKQKNACVQCHKLTRNALYCSQNCSAIANNKNGSIGYKKYRKNNNITKKKTYRDVCFETWEKRCAMCGWDLSIDVHHIDDNHDNNDPRNLIPLCQNHHMKTRMIEHKVQFKIELEKCRDVKMGR